MTGPGVRVVVPMKPLARAKTRLTSVLSPAERGGLVLWLLGRVLDAARSAAGVGEVQVVGGDVAVADLCAGRRVGWAPDPGEDLNAALDAAAQATCAAGWGAMLFLPGDLPWLTGEDVSRLTSLAPAGRLVIVPGERGGTHALLLPCGLTFPFRLGADSFRRHTVEAARRGIAWTNLDLPRLRFDVDTPDDLERLLATEPSLRTGLPELGCPAACP